MTSQCHLHRGKVPYNSRGKAASALRTIRRVGEKREKKPVRTYTCPTCKRRFLTSLTDYEVDDE